MKNIQVIILGDSFNNTLGLIRSLGEAEVDVLLLLVGDDRLYVSKSRYLKGGKVFRLTNLEECLPVINQLYDYSLQQYIICSNDKATQFIDANEEELSQRFITPMRGKHLGNLMDKDVQCKLAEQCGILVPQSFIYERGDEFPHSCSYPILLKPTNSNLGQKSDIHICYSYNEVMQSLSQETSCTKYIVQEYIEKEFEINLIGVSTDKGVCIPGGIKKLRHYPTIYSPCSYGKYISCSELGIDIAPIERFMKEVDFRGPFSVELLHCKGNNYFMEVNFRHDGLAYTATAAGANLLQAYINEDVSVGKIHDIYMMDLSIDYCHVKDGTISFFSWLKDFLHTGCQLNFNWSDPLPTLCYYWNKVFSKS